MNAEEKARYDRQVRLWGKGTQERLRRTEVHIKGVTSATAEVAKNLVLAGVKSVALIDDSPVVADDLERSFLAQGSQMGEKRDEASARKLRALNPHVSVTVRGNEARNAAPVKPTDSCVVVVAIVRVCSEAEALKEAGDPKRSSVDVLLITADLGHVTLGFFLYKKLGIPFGEQLEAILTKNLPTRPPAFQRALLLLKAAECPEGLNYFERLVFASDATRERGLQGLIREDFERACSVAPLQPRSTVIDATVAGGAFAQLIIQTIGVTGEEGHKEGGEYSWVICDTADSVDVHVGRFPGT